MSSRRSSPSWVSTRMLRLWTGRGRWCRRGPPTVEDVKRRLGAGLDPAAPSVTVAELVADWFAGKGSAKASTLRGYRQHVDHYVIPFLGEIGRADRSSRAGRRPRRVRPRRRPFWGSPCVSAHAGRRWCRRRRRTPRSRAASQSAAGTAPNGFPVTASLHGHRLNSRPLIAPPPAAGRAEDAVPAARAADQGVRRCARPRR